MVGIETGGNPPIVEEETEDTEKDLNTQDEFEAGFDRYFRNLGQSKLWQNLKELPEIILKMFSKKK